MDTEPTTIQGFYDAAIKFDANYRDSRTYNRDNGRADKDRRKQIRYNSLDTDAGPSVNSTPRIARLTQEERTKLIKEGRCFRCRQAGHLAVDCPKFASNANKGDKLARIRAMWKDLTPEERDELATTVENQGF